MSIERFVFPTIDGGAAACRANSSDSTPFPPQHQCGS
jgi:hypothetical protein